MRYIAHQRIRLPRRNEIGPSRRQYGVSSDLVRSAVCALLLSFNTWEGRVACAGWPARLPKSFYRGASHEKDHA